MLSKKRIMLCVPLKSVSKGGLFVFNRDFYRRGNYLRRNRVYFCVRLSDGLFVLFSPSELVNNYVGFDD